ncbi:hypothetical protein SAMN05216388_100665 [Halorientalis persicus]|jgi:hypothetical protein|uniref:Uncharacterized protein n=1 Tax=Halorientalis persicus TaxID=1367881 RepID=A0A1H8KHM0_9EURY|nr:hypothetical protein [Halorientalis persicus]SEN92384.1 hypothetical protein SAMN05216388_100665 [Halorientalis persicus]
MERRESLCLLVSVGCLSVSGCLDGVLGPDGVIVDHVELVNTTGVPMDLTVEIAEDGATEFSETVTVLGGYDTRTRVVIPAPVDERGEYTVTARHEDTVTDVDAVDFAGDDRFVSVTFRVREDGDISEWIGSSDDPDYYRE